MSTKILSDFDKLLFAEARIKELVAMNKDLLNKVGILESERCELIDIFKKREFDLKQNIKGLEKSLSKLRGN